MNDKDDYIINMLALQLNEAIEAYDEDYQDVDGSITELGRAIRDYCRKNNLSYE